MASDTEMKDTDTDTENVDVDVEADVDAEANADVEVDEDDNLFIDINFYRNLVKKFIDSRRYPTALFWAEKVTILSDNNPKDIYWLAYSMFLLKEYHRAAHVIKINGLEKLNIPCYSLYLESLYEAKEFNEAVAAINHIDVDFLASSMANHTTDSYANLWLGDDNKNEVMASICLLKGKIFEAMENRALAMDNYIQALKKSIYCYEALEALVQHEMLKAWEEKKLVDDLPFSQQCFEADAKLLKTLYESKLKKYYQSLEPHTNSEKTPIGNSAAMRHIKDLTEKIQRKKPTEMRRPAPRPSTSKLFSPTSEILSPANEVLENLKRPSSYSLQSSLSRASMGNDGPSNFLNFESLNKSKSCSTTTQESVAYSLCIEKLQDSSDIMASQSERLFYDCEYKRSLNMLTDLLKRDPYHNGALTIQIGCLVELKDSNKLYYVAHKLVDRYPEKAISWYAVGCYYDLIGKSDPARRYLSKATSLDRLFGPAWLAYGHSFAKENEHDQAMAAYFKAIQLMKGCHLPLLYIGVECGLTKNLELAEQFFYQAMSIAPLDVFVLHELGVIKYEFEYYETAEEVFRSTVDIVTGRAKENREEISPRWAPLFNNLGHCCRKNKKYAEALEYHELALLLKPQKADTYTSIGFVHSLMGNLEEAVTFFHKSLAINRDCVVTCTILRICMVDLMENETLIDKICGNNLNYKFTPLGEKKPETNDTKVLKARVPKFRFHDRTTFGAETDFFDDL